MSSRGAYARAVDPIGAWTTLGAAATLVLATVLFLQERLPPIWSDALVALGGCGVATGGLLFLDDVGLASWVVAPAVLAVSAVAQRRALFAPGGPLRT